MGVFIEGEPLDYDEAKKLAQHVRKHGVLQFANMYKKNKDRKDRPFKWGDEVEYIIVKFDHASKKVRVSLRSHELFTILSEQERLGVENLKTLWRPEYASFMVEGTPGRPYGGTVHHLNTVEHNMKIRREEVTRLLAPDERCLSITSFPRLGCEDFTSPFTKPTPGRGATQSLFFPDEGIYQGNPRYKAGTAHIRQRRGEKVVINVPVYEDVNTNVKHIPEATAALPNHVYMDSMGFGMGCCCVQVTFQGFDLAEAKHLYDQLTPLTPIMLALTAASPIQKGYLIDHDCRWSTMSPSVDCRTEEERGLKPLKENKYLINKSRCDSIDSYLSRQGADYNDLKLVYDDSSYDLLREHGVDDIVARHVAHIFVRDTLGLFKERIHQDDENENDHFENIQSTNWQTMRFKPPPPNTNIGWRIEFRPCETQLTDFENAALSCFVILMTRVILSYNLNTLIPITKVDENMQAALQRNACLKNKFWFRRDVTSSGPKDCYAPFTLDEIFNGKNGEFPGLIPLIERYLNVIEIDSDTRCTIQSYLNLIGNRASGKLITTASWIRKFVINHPSYKNDSIVTDEINYDLLMEIDEIQSGRKPCPELFGDSTFTLTKENVPLVFESNC